MNDQTMSDKVASLRTYATDLDSTAASYRSAANAPGLPGGASGRAGSYLLGEASRLWSEANTVRSIADEWAARA